MMTLMSGDVVIGVVTSFEFVPRLAELYRTYADLASARPYNAEACEAAYYAWKAELLSPSTNTQEIPA